VHRATSPLSPGVAVCREPASEYGPRWVVARAEAELVARYGSLTADELALTGSTFDPPFGAFLVARAAGQPEPIGGVGVRSVRAGTAEVRRLWVDPAWRGRGVARTLMAALEDAAGALGFSELELGTGDRQPEAVALYASTGWRRRTVDAEGRPVPARTIRFTKSLA
jgi:GNAT superfamily N-acetyltransferase